MYTAVQRVVTVMYTAVLEHNNKTDAVSFLNTSRNYQSHVVIADTEV